MESLTRKLSPGQRAISCAEMGLAIALVLAHNVYRAIPNEVPLLLVLALISFRVREGRWLAGRYTQPKSWPWTIGLSIACVCLLELKDLIVEPIGRHFWPAPEHVSSIISGARNPAHVMLSLLFVWAFAGFAEEIGYRGYLFRRAIDVFGPSAWGTGAALLISSIAFGFGHFYKGPAGILDSTGSGLVLGGLYLYTRSLWASSLGHALNDTLAVVLNYLAV